MFGNFNKFGGQAAFNGGDFVCGHFVATDNTNIDNPYATGSTDRVYGAPFSGNNRNGEPLRCGVFKADSVSTGGQNWYSMN
jgi:hypothetical protein